MIAIYVKDKYNDQYLLVLEVDMRASKEHMEKIRANILDAAGEGFREEGYGGLGINGLVKRAGLTSGAFYGHFSSKNEAFSEVIKNGLEDYSNTIEQLEKNHGDEWPQHFLHYYLGTEHVENLAGSCVVPGLSADVMRADIDTKDTYSNYSKQIANNITQGLHKNNPNDAWALMALLAGGVMMARCVSDPKQEKEILDSALGWAKKMISNE